ncbi:MAG TPA: tetratricopeptide repeat protein [Elusimicrobiales bacterium]|nr:tetratricopeptide repeat protein [Elusimicrobiales bacterium]
MKDYDGYTLHTARPDEPRPYTAPMVEEGFLTQRRVEQLHTAALLTLPPVLYLLYILKPLYSGQLFRNSLGYSLTALALFLVGVVQALKGKPWFSSVIVKIVMLAVPLFILTGYVTEAWINERLDTSRPVVHIARVLRKYAEWNKSRNRSYFTYLAYIESWHDGNQIRWEIPEADYPGIEPGVTVATVETKPGRLGYEFISRVRFGPPPKEISAGLAGLPPAAKPPGAPAGAPAELPSPVTAGEPLREPDGNAELRGYAARGFENAGKGNYDEAIVNYSKVIELDPSKAAAYSLRGSAYSKIGEYEQAIADYSKALALDPGDAGTYLLRSFAYQESGQSEKAQADKKSYQSLSKK